MKKSFIALSIASAISVPASNAFANDAAGVAVGIEFPYLTLSANHGNGDSGGAGDFFEDIENDQAYRLTLSYQMDDEIGVRMRYFNHDADSSEDPDSYFKTSLHDLELTTRFSSGKWNLDPFIGMRLGRIEWADEDGSDGYEFNGTGFTLGTDLRRELKGSLSFVAGLRYSQLFGDTEEESNSTDVSQSVNLSVLDFHAGVEYNKAFSNSNVLTVGFGYESTTFYSLSGNVDNDIDPEDVDVSLSGPSLSAKYSF